MTIEEVKTKRLEMEQRISAAMKEFEESTGLEVKTIGFPVVSKATRMVLI